MAYNKKQQQTNKTNNTIEVKIDFEGISENVKKEVIEVLKAIPFNKISFNVGTYRNLLDEKVPKDDTRVIAVGYVKKFIEDKESFVVGLYAANKDTVIKFKDAKIELCLKVFDDKLGTILKINIIPSK